MTLRQPHDILKIVKKYKNEMEMLEMTVIIWDLVEDVKEEITLEEARTKLIEIWEDDEEGNGPSYGDIMDADFDELDDMLQGVGYTIEEK